MERGARAWILEAETLRISGAIVVALRGRIGSVTAGTFADALSKARSGPDPVVIDLEGVDYICSAGISVLREAVAVGDMRAIVCGLSQPVRITMELAGALDGIAVLENRETAIRSLPGSGTAD